METEGSSNNNHSASTQPRAAQSTSQSQGVPSHAGHAGKNSGKKQEDNTDSDDEEESWPPSQPPPPPPPPVHQATTEEVVHTTDVTLYVLINGKKENHFLRVITKAKVSRSQ